MAPEMNPGRKQIVLIVDDEKIIRDLLQRHLTDLGFEVIMAESGEQAVSISELVRPDLVLLDILMPGMGGIKTLEQLRARYKDLLVIMLTAVYQDQVAEMAMSRGACDYLTKPIELNTLTRTAKTHLLIAA